MMNGELGGGGSSPDRESPPEFIGGFQMKLVRILMSTVLLVTAVAAAAAAQALPDVDRFGPQVGDSVPSFSLIDQHGDARDLQSLMGPDGLMLVFSRSADW